MTEPSPARPVPGPPLPGPAPETRVSEGPAFEELDELPVTEHVAAFEAEHDRLQRELGTIDQL
jgi:hypothetical protein